MQCDLWLSSFCFSGHISISRKKNSLESQMKSRYSKAYQNNLNLNQNVITPFNLASQ